MQHLTFDTCQKLKNAGFPQPEPAFGQLWYRKADGKLYSVESVPPDTYVPFLKCGFGHWGMRRKSAWVYRPDAGDLLQALYKLDPERPDKITVEVSIGPIDSIEPLAEDILNNYLTQPGPPIVVDWFEL